MTTKIIAGNLNGLYGGNIILKAGSGVSANYDGKVIIQKTAYNNPGQLMFEGTNNTYVGLVPGYYGGTTLTLLITNGTTVNQISTATKLSQLTDVSITSPVSGDILMYNGTNWYNALFSFSAPVNVVSPVVGDVLKFNGTEWTNTPSITQENLTVIGGGADVNPDPNKQITLLTTTGTGIATGKLSNGSLHGLIKNITAVNLNFFAGQYTTYKLDVSTNTTFTDASGTNPNFIEFKSTGNSITMVWDNFNGSWYISNAGVHIT